MTGNRTEFIGRNGSLADPAAMHRKRLSGKTGAGLDPCAAIQSQIELADGQEREIVFVFGAASDSDEAQHFVQRFAGPAGARQALERCGITGITPWERCMWIPPTPPWRIGQRLAALPDTVVPTLGS